MIKSATQLAAVMWLALVLSGCVVANAIVEPYTDLKFEAKSNINPDDSGRSSPLVVRVYELSSADSFRDASFFELYDDAKAALEDDLLGSTEVIVRPGREFIHELRLHKATTYLGVIGAFRDIENADWKMTLRADARGYKNRNILINNRSITRADGQMPSLPELNTEPEKGIQKSWSELPE